MSEKDNVRSRDDRNLRRVVDEARRAMQEQGIEERGLDWAAVAREERALWWRERMEQAVADLAGGGREMARLAQSAAEAMVEVTLGAVGRVLPISAEDPGFEFSYAGAGVKGGREEAGAGPESAGVFLTAHIAGAQVVADASAGKVTVEFLETPVGASVLLVPEDADQPARSAEATPRVTFENLPPGGYLLSVHLREPGKE